MKVRKTEKNNHPKPTKTNKTESIRQKEIEDSRKYDGM